MFCSPRAELLLYFALYSSIGGDGRAAGRGPAVDVKVGLRVALGDSASREVGWDDVVGLVAPGVEQHREVTCDGRGLVARLPAEQVVTLRGVDAEVVELAGRAESARQRFDRQARSAIRDVPGQIELRPLGVVLDVAVFLCADGTYRMERVVIRLGGVDLGASGVYAAFLAQLRCVRNSLHRFRNVDVN